MSMPLARLDTGRGHARQRHRDRFRQRANVTVACPDGERHAMRGTVSLTEPVYNSFGLTGSDNVSRFGEGAATISPDQAHPVVANLHRSRE